MTSYLKYSLLLTVAGCFVTMSASARVVKLTSSSSALSSKHMFDRDAGGSGPNGGSCSDYGYYDTTQHGAKCTKVNGYAGATCYRCECDNSVYRVAAGGCNSGLVEDGDYCSLGTTKKLTVAVKRYEGCKCDNSSNYFLSTDYINNVTSHSAFTYTGTSPSGVDKSGKNITCYISTGFSCKGNGTDVTHRASSFTGNAESLTSSTLESFMTYSAASTMKNTSAAKTKVCTTGVTFDGTTLFVSEPTINECAKKGTASAQFYKNTSYHFYTECSTSGLCLGESPSNTHCHTTSQPAVNLYNNTTKEARKNIGCVKTTGCKTGEESGYQCHGTATSSWTDKDFFDYEDIKLGSSGNERTCRKVKGCATGYTKVSMKKYTSETTLSSDVNNAKTDATGGFDVRSAKATSGSNIYAAVCKIQNGCNVGGGYYNIVNSWLKYFEKDLGSVTSGSDIDGSFIGGRLMICSVCDHTVSSTELTDDFVCPSCGSPKSSFTPVVIK